MPEPQEQLEQDPGEQMKKSPLEIRVDNGKHFITIKEGMKVENIGKEHDQPTADTEYCLGSLENLTHQTISANEGKTLYTFAEEGDQIVVIENTTTKPSADKTFVVDNHTITVGTGDGYSYTVDGLPFEPIDGYIKVGNTLIKADKALNTDPHLVTIKRYSLL